MLQQCGKHSNGLCLSSTSIPFMLLQDFHKSPHIVVASSTSLQNQAL